MSKVSDILNSSFVNKLLAIGMSKSGIAAAAVSSWLVAWLLAHAGLANLITQYSGIASLLGITLTVETVRAWITAAAIAILASFFGWIAQRQKEGVKLVQAAINVGSNNAPILKVDGIAGNNTVSAALEATATSLPSVMREKESPTLEDDPH